MTEDLVDLMSLAEGRCDYADVRRIARTHEHVTVRNGAVEAVAHGDEDGIGVRVRVGGAWAFAATGELSRPAAEAALARALEVARALPAAPALPLAPVEPARGHWSAACERDPFAVSLEDKLELLLEAESGLRGDRRIRRSTASSRAVRVTRAFASTEGAACTQEVVECGGGIAAAAVADGETQERSYPSGHGGNSALGGWEVVEALGLAAEAPRVAEEAVALLTAPECPSGLVTIVLHGEQLALQLHESIGHALELDRILGGEAAYAGTSWVRAEDLGGLRYGSELLAVTADATLPGALGSFAWDDEGVPARAYRLISDGLLVGFLSSRESAARIGLEESGACMRADGFARQPIVRMTNVSLEPGEAGSLEDLIAATESGLYLETNRSWSIDDRRLHFQFGTEVAREIRGGELGRLYRKASYAGITPHFWASMDAVCAASEWGVWGLVNCGKGEPGQYAHVSHGTAPARFRDVQVGVA
jgi:TldD protein